MRPTMRCASVPIYFGWQPLGVLKARWTRHSLVGHDSGRRLGLRQAATATVADTCNMVVEPLKVYVVPEEMAPAAGLKRSRVDRSGSQPSPVQRRRLRVLSKPEPPLQLHSDVPNGPTALLRAQWVRARKLQINSIPWTALYGQAHEKFCDVRQHPKLDGHKTL